MSKRIKAFLLGFALGLAMLFAATAAFSHPPDIECSKLSRLAISIAEARDKGYEQDTLLNYLIENVEMEEWQRNFLSWLVVSIYEEGRDLTPYEIGGIVYNTCDSEQ